MRPLRLTLAVAAAALTLVAPASAQNAAPGNSAVDQYLEAVPTATGSKAVGKGTGSKALPKKTKDALAKQGGAEGEALSRLVDETAPPAAAAVATAAESKKAAKSGKKGSAPTTAARVTANEAAAAAEAADQLDGSKRSAFSSALSTGGMGWALPALLGASLLAAVGFAGLKRRA